ncbi:unnamed protein product [Phytomonas sp. Hart1]|nr:unnamed protein product [Phytomonas sp. Hart1]|eukprot:CCW67910.1 unnamed protein product [Phytomonas sp. isolate Hart1]
MAALDARSIWRCKRCGMGLRLPLDPVSGRPVALMLVHHLEGEGEAPLRCTAGPLSCSSKAGNPHNLGLDVGSQWKAAKWGLEKVLQEAASVGREWSRGPALPRVFVVVENPKTPANAGGILRAMGCFLDPMNPPAGRGGRRSQYSAAAGFIFTGERLAKAAAAQQKQDGRPPTKSPWGSVAPLITGTDTQGAAAFIPQLQLPSLQILLDALKEKPSGTETAMVGIELAKGAIPLQDFVHPFSLASGTHGGCPHALWQDGEAPQVSADANESSIQSSQQTPEAAQLGGPPTVPLVFYLFGAEDSSISQYFLDQCKEVVFIPTYGSVNLSASVNVVLYDRVAKDIMTESNTLSRSAKKMSYEERWSEVLAQRNSNNRLNFS